MAYSKVTLNGETLMDVTNDTVEANKLLTGETATAANGQKVTGTLEPTANAPILSSLNITPTIESQFFSLGEEQNLIINDEFSPTISGANLTASIGSSLINGRYYMNISFGGFDDDEEIFLQQGCYGNVYFNGSVKKVLLNQFDNASSTDIHLMSCSFSQEGTIEAVFDNNLPSNTSCYVSIFESASIDGYDSIFVYGVPRGPAYTATITQVSGTIDINNTYITYKQQKYKALNDSFTFYAGDTIRLCARGSSSNVHGGQIIINDTSVKYQANAQAIYTYTLPAHDINIRIMNGTTLSVINVDFPSLSINTNGTYDVVDYAIANVNVESVNNQNKTVTPTESQQNITADSGYTGLGTVTVNAIASTYIGSGVTQKSSSDLTVSGATVTAPAGYYVNAATKSVASGTAGTPTATKETVSNHSVSIRPSVTNTTGYITGGTKVGTAVSVSASELVSGTKFITENGNAIDVTNYANVNVNVPSNDFIINLEPNQNGVFEPDCTFAEAVTAYNAGKTIIFSYDQNPVTGGYDADREWFTYSVYVYEIDGNGIGTMSTLNHRWTSSGVTQTATASYYDLNNQNKTVTPVKSQQSVTADTGYTGLGTVTMNPIPANYVQIKSTYLTDDFNITPSESVQNVEILDQVINSNPQYPTLTISNRVGTCNVSFSGLENNVPYLMDFMVAGSHNNQTFYNNKSIIIMFTNEVTSINLNSFEISGAALVDSAIITKSGNITVNFNVDIIGSAYIALQYKKNNNNIIGCKYFHVSAIPSTYVGSGVATRTSSNLTASGATVTAPAGYYANAATKSVTSGTTGTPTATKGTVSNHSISVTPSVTNTTGYITGSTKTGTAITVSASELVSGTKSIAENGTGIDVTNYASVDVSVPQKRTATIKRAGMFDQSSGNYSYVMYNSQRYYSNNSTFEFIPGSTLYIEVGLSSQQANGIVININNINVVDTTENDCDYHYTLPNRDIEIFLDNDIFQNYIKISDFSDRKTDEQWIGRYNFSSQSFYYSLSSMRIGAFAETRITSGLFNNLTNVPTYAFYSCTYLTTIDLPQVTGIGRSAFYWCYRLSNISASKLRRIDEEAFLGCDSFISLYFPSLTSIGSRAFYNCNNLETINAPILEQIGASAFYNCSSLKNISTENLKSIGAQAFVNCNSLESINVSALNYLGSRAFDHCSNLTYFEASTITTNVYGTPFYSCPALTTISIPALKTIGSDMFKNLSALININITSASMISSYAFNGCIALTSVTAPNISRIDAYAFQSTGISEFIGQKVSFIVTGAFANCSNLRRIILGVNYSSLAAIFSSCYNLISIYLLYSSMVGLYNLSSTFQSTPFYDYSDIAGRWGSIYVPASLYDTYISGTNWKVISSRIVSLTSAQVQALLSEEWIYN